MSSPKVPYNQFWTAKQAPATTITSASASDTVNMANKARSLYVGVGGTVRIMTPSSTVVSLLNVPSGSILPVEAIRVYASGTTATNILVMNNI